MRLVKNSGGDRVVDELRQCLAPLGTLDVATAAFSLFAFAEVQELLSKLKNAPAGLPQTTLIAGNADGSPNRSAPPELTT